MSVPGEPRSGGAAVDVVGDRYELGESLGRGGTADVHRAHDRLLERDVAVKLLRDSGGDERDRARFVQEARTLAGLSHRHLVTVLDAGIAGERPYLVMELVEGPTLAQLVAEGPVDGERVVEAGGQVAEALAYAHANGVVHRDVKPGNILLRPDGRATLADFGIARLVGETMHHTRTGTLIGTAAYLAPEQVSGEEVGPPADVYALALTLLECLTGERAFPGSATEAALARLHRSPEVPDHLPAGLGPLLVEMTDADPARRPTAAEVAQRLRAVGSPGAPAPADAGETRVLPVPDPPARPAPAPARPRRTVADVLAPARQRVRDSSTEARVAAAVVAALLLLIVIAALVPSGSPDPADTGNTDIPADTPSDLRAPLRDLHDAVEGR